MISEETMNDYINRANRLDDSFSENLSKAKDLVVKDSPVDFTLHKFVCSSYDSLLTARWVMVSFHLKGIRIGANWKMGDLSELFKEFESLEDKLAIQNDLLERFTEKISENI